MRTAVVIAVWAGDRRWRRHLRRHLEMISSAPTDWELILIGNGVSFPEASVVTPQNVGVANAWNLGLEATDAEFCCLLNQDASTTIAELMKLTAVMADTEVFVAGPVGSRWDFPTMTSLEVVHPEGVQDTDVVSGFCFTVRRAELLAVGGFDSALAPFSFEEVDVALKARALGKRVVAVGGVAIQHRFGISAARATRKVRWKDGVVRVGEVSARNRAYMIEKFGRMFA